MSNISRRSSRRGRIATGAVLTLVAAMVSVAGLTTPAYAAGTTLFTQTFRQATIAAGGSDVVKPVGSNVACLTAGSNTAATPVPACSSSPTDSAGSGALRLTSASGTLKGGVFAASSIPTANGLDITFDTHQWGGTSADGIAFVLAAVDPTNPQPPASLGQTGGSLGYSATGRNYTGPTGANDDIYRTYTDPGLPYGYLGLGLDVFGNFSNTRYRGTGCATPPRLGSTPPTTRCQVR